MIIFIKKCISVTIILIAITIFNSCAQNIEIVFNEINELTSAKIPFVEGGYCQDMNAEDFIKLTGINIPESLPEKYKNEKIAYHSSYDKDGGLLNLTAGVGEYDNGYTINMDLHSKELWSDLSYSTVDYLYGDEEKNKAKVTRISETDVTFIHYDDSESENKLGYDVYMAKFDIKKIHVYVETKAIEQKDFKNFVIQIINHTSIN